MGPSLTLWLLGAISTFLPSILMWKAGVRSPEDAIQWQMGQPVERLYFLRAMTINGPFLMMAAVCMPGR